MTARLIDRRQWAPAGLVEPVADGDVCAVSYRKGEMSADERLAVRLTDRALKRMLIAGCATTRKPARVPPTSPGARGRLAC